MKKNEMDKKNEKYKKNEEDKKIRKDLEKVVCGYCDKAGHIQADRYKWRHQNECNGGHNSDDNHFAMVTMFEKEDYKENAAFIV